MKSIQKALTLSPPSVCLLQMLAFSLLDAVVAVDWQQRWLHYLTLKGYLRHMIEGLAAEDHMLQSMLDPSPEPLKVERLSSVPFWGNDSNMKRWSLKSTLLNLNWCSFT